MKFHNIPEVLPVGLYVCCGSRNVLKRVDAISTRENMPVFLGGVSTADCFGCQVDQVSLLPSFYMEDTPRSANEAWARLNNDPLFMVRS